MPEISRGIVMSNISFNKTDDSDDISKGSVILFLVFIYALSAFFGYWFVHARPNDPLKFSFTLINQTRLDNGSWIQEIHIENEILYSVACIRDKPPRLYIHTNPTNRTYLKTLCEAPEGYLFHKGLAITRAYNQTYVFVNLHDPEKTLTALYIGETIEDLEFIGIASQAGYFLNTTSNFRIRDVWFNETDQMFYAYYDGSEVWKGTHYYTYLGRSEDPFFSSSEFDYLYCAGNGWNKGGLYAPNVLWLDEYGIGCVKGYRKRRKPYDFDSDLVFIVQPKDIQFFTHLKADKAYFNKYLNDETAISLFFTYNDKLYLTSVSGDYQITPLYGFIYEVEITRDYVNTDIY
jgi:hypothetical protein